MTVNRVPADRRADGARLRPPLSGRRPASGSLCPTTRSCGRHMANTIARHNRRGWRLDKPSPREPNDSIIALYMALEVMENQPEQRSR